MLSKWIKIASLTTGGREKKISGGISQTLFSNNQHHSLKRAKGGWQGNSRGK
jgi:hypothetical protein